MLRLTLLKLDSVCMGKPVSQVGEDIEEGRNIMNFFSGLVELTHGDTSLNTPGHLNMMVRQPFGVVAAIVPWNFPTMLVSIQPFFHEVALLKRSRHVTRLVQLVVPETL